MGRFKEFMKKLESKKFKEMTESQYFFESFDAHYDISKIYYTKEFLFYEFSIREFKYRIFIEDMSDDDMIHIGFEKYDEDTWKWKIRGIDNELKNGEIRKLFGTIIYVVGDLYKKNYSNILFGSSEDKKFRIYLRLVDQISTKLLPNSHVSHNDKAIIIHKNSKSTINLSSITTKYKPNKK